MDLGAFAQIEDLNKILSKNNIIIPRLRGLRLMKNESPISKEEFDLMYSKSEFEEVEDAIRSNFKNTCCYEYSLRTDKEVEKYIEFEKLENGDIDHFKPIKIYWEKLRGEKRKFVKYMIKKRHKRIKNQYTMWNNYCGKDNVLYIHARLGSGNWDSYECDKIIKSQPWYLNHIEDSYDCTYVDIYAKIN